MRVHELMLKKVIPAAFITGLYLACSAPPHHQAVSNELGPLESEFQVLEGDILIPNDHDDAQLQLNSYANLKLWEYGLILYEIAPEIDAATRQQIRETALSYQQKTGLRLVPVSSAPRGLTTQNRLRIEAHPYCASNIGRIGGTQTLRIAPYGSLCNKEWGTLLHEMGHSWGALHEQLHPDLPTERLRLERVADSSLDQYKLREDRALVRLSAYDPLSVMHYSYTQGSICTSGLDDPNWNGVEPIADCMTGDGRWITKTVQVSGATVICRHDCAPVVDALGHAIDRQRLKLSSGDIKGLRKLYPQPFAIDDIYRSNRARPASAEELYRQGRRLAGGQVTLEDIKEELQAGDGN